MGTTARHYWGDHKELQDLSMKDLKGQLPKGTLGNLKISRIILGNKIDRGLGPFAGSDLRA